MPADPVRSLRRRLRDACEAAPALLGCTLVRRLPEGTVRATIVETEAYPAGDPASHSFCGPTARNRSMFARAGIAYVYRIHRSYCLNVVTGPEGRGEAVLIRAVAIDDGASLAGRLRAVAARRPVEGVAVANGPGKLCQSLAVDLGLDGCDLLADGALRLLPGRRRGSVGISPRIGISRSRERRLRFFLEGSPWVSKGRPAALR